MKSYSYPFTEISIGGRKRYNKQYVNDGQIVFYCYVNICDNRVIDDCGLGIVSLDDYLPRNMWIFQPTEREILWVRAQSLYEEYCDANENGIDFISFIIEEIKQCNNNSILREKIFGLPYLINFIDFTNKVGDVWTYCRSTIGLNLNKSRAELSSLLLAELLIISTNKTNEECVDLSLTLYSHWRKFLLIYSLFYGRNISTHHYRFVELLSYLLDREECAPYLHLMLKAIGDKEAKINKILLLSQIDNRGRLVEKITKIEKQRALTEQSTDLNELFQILFPNTFQRYIEKDKVFALIAEIQEELIRCKTITEALEWSQNLAIYLKTVLNYSIKIDDILQSILKMEPAKAHLVFSQLDMELEGNNQVWDNNRLRMKKEVNAYYENYKLMIGETYEQAKLAAEYAKQAATQPHILNISNSTVTNEFADGSCRFEAGSSMNGDVILKSE